MRRYFLGLAANYSRQQRLRHTFAIGRQRDRDALVKFLNKKYGGEQAILAKNGRSALALALKAYFNKGDGIIVNGFTCYAVYEAIKAAGLTPIFADIAKGDLNFDANVLNSVLEQRPAGGYSVPSGHAPGRSGQVLMSRRTRSSHQPTLEMPDGHFARGIIIQNTLGNPVDIEAVEKFAKRHNLTIIEDLAHCVGVKYPDGREAGTVGAAAALSFGKEKSIDTVSGGAVIFRHPCKNTIEAPSKRPKFSDNLRARFYPLLGAICRGLTHIHLGGVLMRLLLKIHWVERSADNKLDLSRKIAKFEAKLALEQLRELKNTGRRPTREFCLVNEREQVLRKLEQAGYYFRGFWYEKPVSPERYYKKAHFPEAECPTAVYVAEHIINLPIYYSQRELGPAREIIKEFLISEGQK